MCQAYKLSLQRDLFLDNALRKIEDTKLKHISYMRICVQNKNLHALHKGATSAI